jgi:hypothetical protein
VVRDVGNAVCGAFIGKLRELEGAGRGTGHTTKDNATPNPWSVPCNSGNYSPSRLAG